MGFRGYLKSFLFMVFCLNSSASFSATNSLKYDVILRRRVLPPAQLDAVILRSMAFDLWNLTNLQSFHFRHGSSQPPFLVTYRVAHDPAFHEAQILDYRFFASQRVLKIDLIFGHLKSSPDAVIILDFSPYISSGTWAQNPPAFISAELVVTGGAVSWEPFSQHKQDEIQRLKQLLVSGSHVTLALKKPALQDREEIIFEHQDLDLEGARSILMGWKQNFTELSSLIKREREIFYVKVIQAYRQRLKNWKNFVSEIDQDVFTALSLGRTVAQEPVGHFNFSLTSRMIPVDGASRRALASISTHRMHFKISKGGNLLCAPMLDALGYAAASKFARPK